MLSGEKSILYRLLLKELKNEAFRYIQALKKELGSHFYICLVDHGLALQKKMNEELLALAKMANVEVVCSNAVTYLTNKQATTLAYLEASAKQTTIEGPVKLMHQEAYLKSEAQMKLLFSDEIMGNTRRLALNCQATIPTDTLHLPKFQAPNHASSPDYLRALCQVGLKKRFQGKEIPVSYQERLRDELKIIIDMKFADYFLIVYDYVRYAKSQGILVGPGRGSAAGSLVSYVLGITNVDPIQYHLILKDF